jgi:spoIIIJ-associated protein
MNEDSKTNDAQSRASLEVIAPSVEEAVAKGLADLGLDRDAVAVDVLDEGSRGVLGIGARQARVRLTIKPASENSEILEQEEIISDETTPSTIVEEETAISVPEDDVFEETEVEAVTPTPVEEETQPTEKEARDEATLAIARDTVIDLLERMHIDADVDAYYAEPDDAHSRSALWVDVSGEDLSILIGHQAETLNALQYITSLIVGKELERSMPLVVDVQGYRKRRAREVRMLARRMAEQAVKTGRRQVLEPMPAYERRLVHIELRNTPLVETESIGEEPRRKVTIIPVEQEEL